jgi:hypothetical protein
LAGDWRYRADCESGIASARTNAVVKRGKTQSLPPRKRASCGITAYMENGGLLENAQNMAAHESPRTTKLYDRTEDQITIEEVEKIVI